MGPTNKKVFEFCNIQLQVLKEKEDKLRKEILDCKIQREFLLSIIVELTREARDDEQ
jgi:hypothetical protein